MNLSCKNTPYGLLVKFQNKKYRLKYPKKIWLSYPQKNILTDNLVHLMTINLPLVAGFKEIKYSTSLPLFSSQFFEMLLRDIPASVHDHDISAAEKIKEFMNINYQFRDYNVKLPSYNADYEERAIIPLSIGKDSLLTLGICNEIGLNPVSVYINDTISPAENRFKIKNSKALTKKLKLKHYIIENQLQKLNDFDYWNKDCTDLGYSHMITGFCFAALPFCHYHKAKYIVLGNQRNMNYSFLSKDGFTSYPSFDQRKESTKLHDSMIRQMTNNQATVLSVIEPLTNLAIIKILYSRYPHLADYTMSCDCLDVSKEKRWCHDCNKCARLSLMMQAFNVNPKKVGFRKNLLDRKHKQLYVLFNGKEVDHYEKSHQARDEQLLAFYLAYRNNTKGHLMDLFKKKFLKEAQQREDELLKGFMTIHDAISIPRKIKPNVLSIYKEEL